MTDETITLHDGTVLHRSETFRAYVYRPGARPGARLDHFDLVHDWQVVDYLAAESRARIAAEGLADKAEAELRNIDDALNSVTKCEASTRAQRIKDSFLHNELVSDAVIFEHDKAEQSCRAQVVLWMEQAKAEGERANAEKERANGLDTACNMLRAELSPEQTRAVSEVRCYQAREKHWRAIARRCIKPAHRRPGIVRCIVCEGQGRNDSDFHIGDCPLRAARAAGLTWEENP